MELNYNKDIELLNDTISLVFINDVKYNTKNIILKYKELILQGNLSAIEELNTMLSESSIKVLRSLSKKYIKHITTFYFSDEGIILYIVILLRTKLLEIINAESINLR